MKLLKFYLPTCPPCKSLNHLIEAWGKPKYEIVNINIKENPDLKLKYGIKSVPTIVKLDDNGDEVDRVKGVNMKTKSILYDE